MSETPKAAPSGGGPAPGAGPWAANRVAPPPPTVPAGEHELLLVGTGHVYRLRERVGELIRLFAPRVVAVELDAIRLQGLLEKERAQAEGRKLEAAEAGFVYRMMARFQERMAKAQGSEVGEEMMAAVDAARGSGLPLLTIDVDARGLFGRAWRQMRWRERLKLVGSAVKGSVGGQQQVDAEIAQYNEDPATYLARIGDELPTLKRVFIDERDAHMARALTEALARYGLVAAIVGDGHVEGLRRLLEANGCRPRVEVRLPDLTDPKRYGKVREAAAEAGGSRRPRLTVSDDGISARFSF